MNDKVYALIGLAQKAGRLVSGENACIIDIKKGKSELVIIAEDSSDNTKKQFENMCGYRNIPVVVFGTKALLGKYTGKGYRAVICVKDHHFARSIIQKLSGGEAFV